MNDADKKYLDEAFELLDERLKDPYWKPVIDAHHNVDSEWLRTKSNRDWIVEAYDLASPWAKRCFNLLIEAILESDMQGITIDPAQIEAVIDSGAYMLQTCERKQKSP